MSLAKRRTAAGSARLSLRDFVPYRIAVLARGISASLGKKYRDLGICPDPDISCRVKHLCPAPRPRCDTAQSREEIVAQIQLPFDVSPGSCRRLQFAKFQSRANLKFSDVH